MTSFFRQLVPSSGLSLLYTGLRTTLGLISVPITLSYLDVERYGLWMATVSVFAFMTLLDAGVTPALKNQMSVAFGVGDTDEFDRAANASVALAYLFLALALPLAGLASSLPWQIILNLPSSVQMSEVRWLVGVVSLIAISTVGLAQVESVHAAQLQLARVRLYDIAAAVCSFGLLLLAVWKEVPLPVLAASAGLPMVATRILLLTNLRTSEKVSLRVRAQAVMNAFKNGKSFLGIKVAEVIISAMPPILLAKFVSLPAVTLYSVVGRVVGFPLMMLTAVLPPLWASFTIWFARHEYDVLRRGIRKILISVSCLFGAWLIGVALIGPLAIQAWTAGRVEVTRQIVVLYALFVFVQALFYVVSTFLHGVSDFTFELACHVAMLGTLALTLPWLLAKFGLAGLLSALVLAFGLSGAVPTYWRARQHLRVER